MSAPQFIREALQYAAFIAQAVTVQVAHEDSDGTVRLPVFPRRHIIDSVMTYMDLLAQFRWKGPFYLYLVRGRRGFDEIGMECWRWYDGLLDFPQSLSVGNFNMSHLFRQ